MIHKNAENAFLEITHVMQLCYAAGCVHGVVVSNETGFEQKYPPINDPKSSFGV